MSTSICIHQDIKLSSHSESIFINFGNFTILPEQRFSSWWPLYYTYTLCIWTSISIYGCRGFCGGGQGMEEGETSKSMECKLLACKNRVTGIPWAELMGWLLYEADRCRAEHVLYSFYGHFLEIPLLKKGLSHHLCTPPFTESYL